MGKALDWHPAHDDLHKIVESALDWEKKSHTAG
jgi:UDP-glucose 4-epimerase